MSDIDKKVVSATKWSTITEIAAKLVSPITTMVLARLLTPADFGVLVTATMVISFSEIFTDAGFQKYLIQKKFETEKDLKDTTTVAFWSNFVMSIAIWLVIVLFCGQIAELVGNPGRGNVIAISCICIPLAAFSSIQMALFKRKFDFKTLFWVRIIGILIPIVVTIPLAFFSRSYWALIIGMIALNASNAIILTIKSEWKPRLFYDWAIFKRMFSFSFWSMIEAVTVWLTSYVDLFIVGKLLNEHYLGIYRTSMSTVGQIMSLITAATTPVLFSALSRLQDDENEFRCLFFRFQKIVGLLVIPLGVGIFLFRNLVTEILLGHQWLEAANFIGLWGLTSSITIVLSHYCSEIYRAKGRPKLSVLAQVLHIFCLVPVVLWAINYGFDFLCEMRALVRLTLIVINLAILYWLSKISPLQMLDNIKSSIIGSIAMILLFFLLPSEKSIFIQISCVFLCSIVYLFVIMLFKEDRKILLSFKNIIKK